MFVSMQMTYTIIASAWSAWKRDLSMRATFALGDTYSGWHGEWLAGSLSSTT